MKCSLGISNFLEEISSLSHSFVFLFFFCIDHWGRLSYLSLVFFGSQHSNGHIFPFHLCLSGLFFSQLFVRPPQTTIFPFCISFSWGRFWSRPPVQCYKPSSIAHQAFYQTDIYVSVLSGNGLKSFKTCGRYWANMYALWVSADTWQDRCGKAGQQKAGIWRRRPWSPQLLHGHHVDSGT